VSGKENEINKTIALAFPVNKASVKIRMGMPVDEEEDLQLPIWSGIIPLRSFKQRPVTDGYSVHIPIPEQLK
jgi:hypothetical protein